MRSLCTATTEAHRSSESPCSTREATIMISLCIVTKSSPCLPQLEKSQHSNEDAPHSMRTYRWPTNRGKDAQRGSLLEKCKSKLQWNTTSHQSEWPSPKNLQTLNAGDGVEKRKSSCTVGGNVNWYSHYWRQIGDPSKTRNKATIWPSN